MDSRSGRLVVILLAGMALFSSSSFGADSETFKLPFHLKWASKLKKEKFITKRPFQFATPAIDNGVAYVGAVSGFFYAIDIKKGKKLWETKLDSSVYAEAATDGEMVYVSDRKGTVYAIKKADGKIEWRAETLAEVMSKPAIDGDTIFVTTAQKQVVAIGKSTGGIRWQTQKIGAIPKMTLKGSASPVIYNGKLYTGFSDGMFYCYSTQDGSIVWARQLASKGAEFSDIDSTPLFVNGVLYVSTVEGNTFALSPSDGQTIWAVGVGGPNDPFFDGKFLYVSGNAKLRALRPEDGVIVWEQKFDEPEISSPAVKDGLAAVISTKEKLYIVDAENGTIKHQRYLGKGSFGNPIIRDNLLYILGNSSALFSIK